MTASPRCSLGIEWCILEVYRDQLLLKIACKGVCYANCLLLLVDVWNIDLSTVLPLQTLLFDNDSVLIRQICLVWLLTCVVRLSEQAYRLPLCFIGSPGYWMVWLRVLKLTKLNIFLILASKLVARFRHEA